MIRFLRVVVLVAFFSAFTPLPGQAAPVSPLIPLDSWVYPALDKLSGLGLITSSLAGSRPYSRYEAARQVAEASRKLGESSAPPVVHELLQRLETELSASLAEVADGGSATGYFKPVRQLRVDYIYQDGDPSTYPRTNSRQFSLNKNNFGLDYSDGSNGQLSLQGDARFSHYLGLEWQPLLLAESPDDLKLKWLTARASVGLGPVEFSAGRQSLSWGQGHNGSLLLSNNGKPLDMLRINNPTPIQLPWVFAYLGDFHFDLFWSQLEKDRQVPEPYFAGMRLNIKPLPWLELGATRTVMFGGQGRPGIDWHEFITILGGKNLEGDKDSSNSIAAVDMRITFPALRGAQLYAECGGEDEANHFFSKTAWLAGIYLPQVESSGRLSLRLEYTDLSNQVWYRHGTYRSGYTYEEHIMGHHIGGAAKDYFVETRLLLREDLDFSLGFDYQKRGEDQSNEERHSIICAKANWWMNKQIRFELQGSLDRTENFGFVSGDDPDFYYSRLSMIYSW